MSNENQKPYRELLQLFVSKDHLRIAMCTPFIQGNFAIGTDAHSLICFESKLLPEIDFESHEKAPNALAVIPAGWDGKTAIASKDLAAAIAASDKLHKILFTIKTVQCPDCDGSGYVDFTFYDHQAKRHELEGDCPTCDTAGQIRGIVNNKTNEAIYDECDQYISFGGETRISTDLVRRLVTVAEKLGEEVIYLYSNSKKLPKKFSVGAATVVLMAAMDNDDPCSEYFLELTKQTQV